MNKREFLKELEERLIGISKEDKIEILQDYEEHFKVGKKKKRSEAEIAESLGNPKEIAREIRKELSQKNGDELKTEAIETWVVVKQVSKHLFNETKIKAEEIYNKFNPRKVSPWFVLVFSIVLLFLFLGMLGSGFFVFLVLSAIIFLIIKIFEDKKIKFSKKQKKKSTKEKTKHTRETSFLKAFLLLVVNILVVIWVWISLLVAICALIFTGVVMIISGVLLMVLAIFYLFKHPNTILIDIYLSVLFAGLGTGALGMLFAGLFDKLLVLFFKGTRKYIKLNKEIIKK